MSPARPWPLGLRSRGWCGSFPPSAPRPCPAYDSKQEGNDHFSVPVSGDDPEDRSGCRRADWTVQTADAPVHQAEGRRRHQLGAEHRCSRQRHQLRLAGVPSGVDQEWQFLHRAQDRLQTGRRCFGQRQAEEALEEGDRAGLAQAVQDPPEGLRLVVNDARGEEHAADLAEYGLVENPQNQQLVTGSLWMDLGAVQIRPVGTG